MPHLSNRFLSFTLSLLLFLSWASNDLTMLYNFVRSRRTFFQPEFSCLELEHDFSSFVADSYCATRVNLLACLGLALACCQIFLFCLCPLFGCSAIGTTFPASSCYVYISNFLRDSTIIHGTWFHNYCII